MRTQGVWGAGQLSRGAELDERPERHSLKVQVRSGDVLAELSGADLETSLRERCEELETDQVTCHRLGRRGRRLAR